MTTFTRETALAALDPQNEPLVRDMARYLSMRLWTHDTSHADVVRELLGFVRHAAGLDPEPPHLTPGQTRIPERGSVRLTRAEQVACGIGLPERDRTPRRRGKLL